MEQDINPNDSMVRRLEYDSSSKSSHDIQNTMGVFGESAFEKFIKNKNKEQETLSPHKQHAFSQYSTPQKFNNINFNQ